MASTYVNDLRLEEIGTGEASGTWGTKTNTNLELISEAFSYGAEVIDAGATDIITLADGTSDQARSLYLKCTGADQNCTVTLAPATVSKVWIIENATSHTLTFKQGSSGASVAILSGQVKMIATDGGGATNGIVYDLLTDVNLAGTTVTDIVTANQATVDDIDLNGKVITLTGSSGDTATITVAENGVLTIATTDTAAAAANISITADGTFTAAGTTVTLDSAGTFTAAGTTVTLDSAGDIVLDAAGDEVIFKDGSTDVGHVSMDSDNLTIKSLVSDKDIILQGNDGGSAITALTLDMSEDGAATFKSSVIAVSLDISGDADIDGTLEADVLTVDGVAAKVAGLETIYVPATAMYPTTTSGCASLAQVELSNGPELRCLDFDASSAENAQFTVCFPKSWNEGTITFQAFWTVTGTDTGTVAWGLSGVSIADDVSVNTAFGTNVVATAKAFSGTSNDMTVSAVSGAVTVASAAVDTQTYFQIMRDVTADDQTGDARLLGMKLFYTTDAKNDA